LNVSCSLHDIAEKIAHFALTTITLSLTPKFVDLSEAKINAKNEIK